MLRDISATSEISSAVCEEYEREKTQNAGLAPEGAPGVSNNITPSISHVNKHKRRFRDGRKKYLCRAYLKGRMKRVRGLKF